MATDSEFCKVRTARRGDLLAVLAVYAQRDSARSAPESASELEQATWARMMSTGDLTVYLGELDGEPVGTATLLLMPNLTYDCAPTAFVEAVVVAVGHRRKGVATAIMNRILRDSRSAGCNKVQLLSHKRHAIDGGHGLHRSLGFEAEAEGFRLYHQEVPPRRSSREVQVARGSANRLRREHAHAPTRAGLGRYSLARPYEEGSQ